MNNQIIQDNDYNISKVYVRGEPLYIKTQWKENDTDLFSVIIFYGDHSWAGRFSTEFEKKYRELVDEDVEEYRKNVKCCLSGKDSAKYSFDFVSNPGDTLASTFMWKKKFEGSALLLHGSVPVHKDSTPLSKDILIDILLGENTELQQEVQSYTELNAKLNEDFEMSKRQLEKFINLKTTLETCLYGKFVRLLNEKKKRIQLLDNSADNFKQFKTNMDSDVD